MSVAGSPDRTTTAPDRTTTAPDRTTTAPDRTTTAPDRTTTAPDRTTTAKPIRTVRITHHLAAGTYRVDLMDGESVGLTFVMGRIPESRVEEHAANAARLWEVDVVRVDVP